MPPQTTPAPAKPDNAGVRVYPAMLFLLCLTGGIAADWWLASSVDHLPQPASFYVGAGVIVAAVVFAGLGVARFFKLKVDPLPTHPAARLVWGGVYRISRNPMYVGLVVFLAGIGIASGSLPVLASAVPLFLLLDLYVIRREERYLRRTFGEEYLAYCKKVRRWL